MDEQALYASRLELVDFLIEALYDLPDEAFVAELLDGEFRTPESEVNDALDHGFDALRSFVADNADRDVEAVHDDIEREYTRLFVGPRPPVMAHETYYRDDTDFMGEGLAAVEASYGAAGWSPPEEYPEENDFVAVELAFLRHLIDQQRQGVDESVGYERVFLDEHALQWVEPFTTDLREQADSRFYVAVASIYDGLLTFEDELVAQML
ncbi:MAG: molecular chaperone [Haloplanus sp.]